MRSNNPGGNFRGKPEIRLNPKRHERAGGGYVWNTIIGYMEFGSAGAEHYMICAADTGCGINIGNSYFVPPRNRGRAAEFRIKRGNINCVGQKGILHSLDIEAKIGQVFAEFGKTNGSPLGFKQGQVVVADQQGIAVRRNGKVMRPAGNPVKDSSICWRGRINIYYKGSSTPQSISLERTKEQKPVIGVYGQSMTNQLGNRRIISISDSTGKSRPTANTTPYLFKDVKRPNFEFSVKQ